MSSSSYTSVVISNFGSKHFDTSALRAAFDGCKEAIIHKEKELEQKKQQQREETAGTAAEEQEGQEGEAGGDESAGFGQQRFNKDEKAKKKPWSTVEGGSMLWGQAGGADGRFCLCRIRSDIADLVTIPEQAPQDDSDNEEEATSGRKSGRRRKSSGKKKVASLYPKREIVCGGTTLKIQKLGYDLSTVRPKVETQTERRASVFGGNKPQKREKPNKQPRKAPQAEVEDHAAEGGDEVPTAAEPESASPPKKQLTKFADSDEDDDEVPVQKSRGKRERDTEAAQPAPAPAEVANAVPPPQPRASEYSALPKTSKPPVVARAAGSDACKFCGSTDHLSRRCNNKGGNSSSTAAPTTQPPEAAAMPAPAKPVVAEPAVAPVAKKPDHSGERQEYQQRPSGGGSYNQQASSGGGKSKSKSDACKHCGSSDHLSRQCKNK